MSGVSTVASSSWWCPSAFSAGDCSDLFLKRSSLRLCCRRLYEGVERFFVLGGTAFSLDSENEKDPSRLSEKVYLNPCLVSELHSSLQRSNQDSKALFFGENSISTPIVAVSVWLQCRRCGAHAYSVPDSTQRSSPHSVKKPVLRFAAVSVPLLVFDFFPCFGF